MPEYNWKKLSVTERRKLLADEGAEWVCERCGDQNEEGVAVFEVKQATRMCPEGRRVVILCGSCAEKTRIVRVIDS